VLPSVLTAGERHLTRVRSGRSASSGGIGTIYRMTRGIRNRARFLTRPDLDSDDFTDYFGVVIGQECPIQPDGGRLWRVAEVQQDETPVETIVFEPVS
jgi:hypothetical protein